MTEVHNVDNAEIAKFSQIATQWWDPQGHFKPLHDINPLRLSWITDNANGLFGKSVVDVGCGGGILAESMARAGAQVTGIDMAEASLEVAKLHGLESGVKVDYSLTSAEQFAASNAGKFDVVTCMEMLEHVPAPASVVSACSQLVKPGGWVFFSTLNRNLKAYAMAIIGAEKVLRLVPEGTHEYEKFIKPSELLKMADTAQLKARNMTGLHLNPLTGGYYLSDKNVDVNYLIACQRLA
ncbi:bifunctional 2-polyprenyl-6-hydroxyphenol methylase/3-demethylubiquinol 3-O-methyltransferase UbiG [Aestuariibacter salexigens]|uniref:bifunctional 2-polyprenyl-6-hydroxyphenol methylase/3-demethylubiquinol 3-O-methyltransferase UbiG n=1 Tax=Aestuariibacter salexigens TaxID=226010 RepID=UPI000417ABA9|nr:bifunctional 2-polyprenyl-6-hydroxyphenol methylase/3-demethylubiquinol 3-O-methyltransferase UbiG [Aestuariibacter salexigens]